jgi:hypothetical protein
MQPLDMMNLTENKSCPFFKKHKKAYKEGTFPILFLQMVVDRS